MKTKQSQFASALMGITFAVMSVNPSAVLANDEQYLNSDPIHINGYVQAEAEPTDHELETIRGDVKRVKNMNHINKKKTKNLRKLVTETAKLSETSEEMIEERQQAEKEMAEYNKKIDCMMGRKKGPECKKYIKKRHQEERHHDSVTTGQAAAQVEHDVVTNNYAFGSLIKILPYSGITTFDSENENLEANITAGLKVESNINSRFSVGLGFNYLNMMTQDFGNNMSYFGSSQYYGNYNTSYNNFYGGREIEFKNMNFSLYSKFFIVAHNRFRPYVGAGLGYNRTNISYSDNRSFYGSSYGYNNQFGDEEVITSAFNAELMAGSEVIFTDMIGMILEFNYQRGIGGNISADNAQNAFYAPDQQRLQDLNEELQAANIFSLYAGLLVQF